MIIFHNFTFNHFLLINHTYFSNGFSSSTFFLIKKGWNPINFQQKIKERTNIFILYNHHLLRHHLVCWIAWLLEVWHRISHNEILTLRPVVHCMSLLYCCLFLLKIPLHFEHSPIFYTFLSTWDRRVAGTRSWAKWWSWLRSGLGLPRNSGGRELLSTALRSLGTGISLSWSRNLQEFIIH